MFLFYSEIILNLLLSYDFQNLDHSKQIIYGVCTFQTNRKAESHQIFLFLGILGENSSGLHC